MSIEATSNQTNCIVPQKDKSKYYAGFIRNTEKKISALLAIVSNVKTLLDDELTNTKEFIQEGYDTKMLLDDVLSTIEICGDDLEAFFSLLCDEVHSLRTLYKEMEV